MSLKIAPGLTLDPDYVAGGTFALLAKKGAGKTYTGRVMAEEFWKAKVPFVALDPMDAWWGLRSSADGEGEGIPVAIFGGPHGDAPLERTGGKLMADLVVDEGLSMVLCLKDLGTRAAERQFALDFLERLYRRNSELVHLMIDEADLFAPQKPQSGDQQLLGVTENIVRRGRNSGIGITLITQRPAVLNKDVLTQVDGLCVMRITGYNDREAIDDWVRGHSDEDLAKTVKPTLSSLANGECWWWVPELDVLKRVQVRRSKTFDSSPTRRRGDQQREPKSFADVDMGSIEERMTATLERAKESDPKELRARVAARDKRIADLERDLEARPTEQVETEKEVIVEVPTPVFNGEVETLERVATAIAEIGRSLETSVSVLASSATAVADAVTRAKGVADAKSAPARADRHAEPPPRPTRAQPRPAHSTPEAPRADGDFTPTGPQQKILNALAWLQSLGLAGDRRRVGFLAGYSQSGNFATLISGLHVAGMLSYPVPGEVALTDAGAVFADHPDVPPTSADIQAQVMAKLKGPQRKLMTVLIPLGGEAITRAELAEATGYQESGNFATLVSSLKTLGVLTYPARGLVAADPVLFIE